MLLFLFFSLLNFNLVKVHDYFLKNLLDYFVFFLLLIILIGILLQTILNKSWRQRPTKQQLYGHLSPIMKTIKIIQTRHAGHCWRSRDELISDVLLWTPSHGWAKAGRPAQTDKQQLSADMGCSLEDLLEAMDNREVWQERVRNIRADGAWWWWWWRKVNYTSQYF